MNKSRPKRRKVEFIESYWTGDEFGSDYQWDDNHGELIRCKDCKHRDPEDHKCDCGHDIQWQLPRADDWFCADGIAKDTDVLNK